jgi:hypothetical protein
MNPERTRKGSFLLALISEKEEAPLPLWSRRPYDCINGFNEVILCAYSQEE